MRKLNLLYKVLIFLMIVVTGFMIYGICHFLHVKNCKKIVDEADNISYSRNQYYIDFQVNNNSNRDIYRLVGEVIITQDGNLLTQSELTIQDRSNTWWYKVPTNTNIQMHCPVDYDIIKAINEQTDLNQTEIDFIINFKKTEFDWSQNSHKIGW